MKKHNRLRSKTFSFNGYHRLKRFNITKLTVDRVYRHDNEIFPGQYSGADSQKTTTTKTEPLKQTFKNWCRNRLKRKKKQWHRQDSQHYKYFRLMDINNNYSPKWRWLILDIYLTASQFGKYSRLATDTEVNNCYLYPSNGNSLLD